jgi:O-antigen ligase
MAFSIDHTHSRSREPAPGKVVSVVRRVLSSPRTTLFERLLLIVPIVIMPLNGISVKFGGEIIFFEIAGFSLLYILFGIQGIYLLLIRPGALVKTWYHPIFLMAYILLILGTAVEFSHPHASLGILVSLGSMFVGAVFIASLCRDREALQACLYGLLIAGMWVSVYLFFLSYSGLSEATTTNFEEAVELRAEIFKHRNMPLKANANFLSFFSAQGAVIALALALKVTSACRRNLLLGASLFCFVASFLGLSRGAVVMVIISCTFVMLSSGIQRFARFSKMIVVATVFVIGALMWVPDAVFSRMVFIQTDEEGVKVARHKTYNAALEHLPEYLITGVGAGNFWGPWGVQSKYGGYIRGQPRVGGAHNGLIQVTLYWGLVGLIGVIAIIYQAYSSLPSRSLDDPLVLCLYGLCITLFLYLQVHHVITAKQFAVGLGLLVGARRWIWPKGSVRRTQPNLVRRGS